MARVPRTRTRPTVSSGFALPGTRNSLGGSNTISMHGSGLREYTFIGPRDHRPPTPVIRENSSGRSRPPRGYVQIIPPGGAPRRGPLVPQIDGRKPGKQLRPFRHYPWRFAAPLRPLLRVHPMFRAVDMGFQLLDGWAKYGPQQEGEPGQEPWLDGAGTEWFVDQVCPEPRTPTHASFTFAPPANFCQAGQAGGTEENTLENFVWPTEAGNIPRRVGIWEHYMQGTIPRTRAVERWNLPRRTTSPAPVYHPRIEPQPGRETVQRAPVTVTPPWPAFAEKQNGPKVEVPSTYPPRYTVAADTVEVSSGGGAYTPNDRHVLAPPAPGQKELKVKVHGSGDDPRKLASWLWDRVTHYDDLIDIIADSIVGNPCRSGTPQAKIHCISQNLDKIDPGKLLAGYIYNEFEDRLVGEALKYSKRLPFGGMAPGRMGDRQPLNIRPMK